MKRCQKIGFAGLIFSYGILNAQIELVDVAHLKIKVGGLSTKELYYGFAEGDQIIFSMEVSKGKEIKELEILELPGNTKFMDYKTSSINSQTIKVHKKGVYRFRFTNVALGGRVCKVHIQRLPKSEELISFNTDWHWKTLYDTTYVPYTKDSLIGYRLYTEEKSRKELVAMDTIATELFSKTERVHSEMALGKVQYSWLTVQLPSNTYDPHSFNPYQSTEVMAWSYWIGVGPKAIEDYERANRNLSLGIRAIGGLTGYGALAELAVSGVSMFSTPQIGDNVGYKFISSGIDGQTVFDSGNGIEAYGRNTKLLRGDFVLELYNDNIMEEIDVTVKVVAITIRKTWEDQKYTVQKKEPQYVTLNKKKMVVTTRKIRINSGEL